jgi:glutamate-ammonia-ligase adenylyltransferase
MTRPRSARHVRRATRKPRSAAASPRVKLPALLSARGVPRIVAQQLLRAHGFHDTGAALATIGRLHADALQRRTLRNIFTHLIHACQHSADPDRALLNFERLVAALPNPNMLYHYLAAAPDRLDLLVRIFAQSHALAETLARNAEHFHFLIAPKTLEQPRSKGWLDAELRRLLLPMRQPADRYDVIRRFRRRETLRIGARDLVGRATVEETTLELSNLADVCLQAVFEVALSTLRRQFKVPASAKESTARFTIIGMGKLGGQELNYSSDVDVIFVYDEDGDLTPTVSRHQFFTKLAEEICRAVAAKSDEGTIFRIDLRLRPHGSAGPLVCALDSYENYYAEVGETWERMALSKARRVAGDAALGAEFIEMLKPFVFARHAGLNVIQQMGELKARIENEIVREEHLTRHVKLGIGGIREIEFIVQSFQILRGARVTSLRERSTLKALALLARHKLLTEHEARTLGEAYRFLRNVEHRLQMEMELQTHTIPDEHRALTRLARGLGFASVENFRAAQETHTAAVRGIYAAVLSSATQASGTASPQRLTPETLAEVLDHAGFTDMPAAVKTVDHLLHGPGFVHVSQRTKECFAQLFPALLAAAKQVADPDAALARFEQFVGAYGSRGLLYEALAGNTKLVEMLVRVGDASRFLSDTLARQPELFDEVCRGVSLSDPKTLDRMFEELRAAGNGEDDPAETARVWKRSELLRIGIEDVMGLVDLEQTHLEMTCLAEACLRFALDHARRQLTLAKFPFAVIGMGKFGGKELGFGADLDVLFVGGKDASDQPTAIKLASRVIEFMARQTGGGALFPVDARLRPDGEKGPLVTSLDAHRDYYRHRAQLWERQALLKARFVAGDVDLGKRFAQMVQEIAYDHALTAAELDEIKQMRHRIETERGDPRHRPLEFKTGPGGLIDVEFLVQALQLRHGPSHANLRTAHLLAALNRLTSIGALDDEQSYHLRRNYLFLRRIENVLRRAENTSVSRVPVGEREQAHLAKRLGFDSAGDFMKTYELATQKTRSLYDGLMTA